jgi:hypothetical protein
MGLLGIWISAFLTLAIFSFLYKDNPIYKFAEHLFVGISAGYAFIQAITGTLRPNLYEHVKGAMETGDAKGLVRLGALVLGGMMLMRLSPKGKWISRWPLALMIGAFAALRLTGLAQSDLVRQINGTMIPIYGKDIPWLSWEGPSIINNWILITGVICVLVYFFFSREQKTPTKQISYLGTVFLMITFGSSFGYTVLGRLSLLIGRAQDLYVYAERRNGYASIVCAIIVILYLVIWEMMNKAGKSTKP